MLEKIKNKNGQESVLFWCPPCRSHHAFIIKRSEGTHEPEWEFNGDLEKPTFSPSLLYRQIQNKSKVWCCHLFLRDGIVEYLNDCTHEAAGTKVPVHPPL